jgi:hypothetical protein
MTHELIKTENYLLVVDESEIKKSNWCIMFDSFGNIFSNPQQYTNPETQHLNKGLKKIIAHLPLNNSPILEGVDLLPPLEDNVKWFDEFIQSLQQPKYPVGFECEEIYCGYTEDEAIMKPKTITNPQGITQLVGTYKY